ncbi:MFS transporter [Halococcus thailandensis]|uniref:Multidrug-efflux transporter n=1 Tax=Halococcus thailandensis JCM 13552 TaxID=1227457 RepID=M0N270_9EURY|nr:MFS transporter [Halococcus thailandensis]EMA51608.1 multidrug-efflux transporter [Halococcus thailandensis JCM 13552]
MARSSLPAGALAVLGTGLFGIGLAVGGYGASVTALIEQGVAADVAGFGMTIYLLGQVVAALPADRLTRRYGPRRVVVGGFAVGTAGAIIGGTLDLRLVYLSRVLLGVGTSAALLAGLKYAGHRTDRESRSLAQGLLGGAFTLGLAGGLVAGPPLLARYGPVALALLAAIVTAAPAALVLRLEAVPTDPVRRVASYLAPLRSTTGIVLGLANMMSFGLLIVATTWYGDVLGTEPTLPATVILLGFSLATVGGRFGGGWIARALNERAAVALTLGLLCLLLGGAAAAIAIDAPLVLGVMLLGTGAGFGLPFGPLFGLAFSNLADDAGLTLVTMMVIGNAGALVYPWLIGRSLRQTGSYTSGFLLMALSVGVVVVLLVLTIGLGSLPSPSSGDADVAGGR